jgi:hypothetical protein
MFASRASLSFEVESLNFNDLQEQQEKNINQHYQRLLDKKIFSTFKQHSVSRAFLINAPLISVI